MLSGVAGVLCGIEMSCVGQMHSLILLRGKNDHQFRQAVEKLDSTRTAVGLSSAIVDVKHALTAVRMQSMNGMPAVGPIQQLVLSASGRNEALAILAQDLALAKETLYAIQAYESQTTSKRDLCSKLRLAVTGVSGHSSELVRLLSETASMVSNACVVSVVLAGLFVSMAGFCLLSSIVSNLRQLTNAPPDCARDYASEATMMSGVDDEREQLQGELLSLTPDTGKEAESPEVSTEAVLHNVGNVLNSVNVSTVRLRERIVESPVAHLCKAAEVIGDHRNDLSDFLTNHQRGRHFPKLIEQLAFKLNVERETQLQEIDKLAKNVEHISEIVRVHQSSVKPSTSMHPVDPIELFEDAIRINEADLAFDRIIVIRDYQQVPEIRTSKHDVLQILVNLIKNSQQAMELTTENERSLRLIVRYEDNSVRFEVQDTGIGISPNNLKQMFQHGFTTKKTGHGFGLHSCAVVAQSLGGSMSVRSDGEGKGACFALTLPLQLAPTPMDVAGS